MFGGSVCASADLLPPAGEGWHSLVEVRDGNAQPLGKPLARGSTGIHPAPLSAAAYAPVKNSQRQRKSTLVHASTTPTTSAPSATGRQLQESQKSIACPTARQNRSRHRSADPRRAEGHCTGARQALFSLDRARPVSLLARQKRNGGCIPAGPAPLREQESPVAAVRRPIPCYPRWSVRPSR